MISDQSSTIESPYDGLSVIC